MEKNFLNRCYDSGVNPEFVSKRPKIFVLIHRYIETGFNSIVAFSDSYDELDNIKLSHPRFGSSRHEFYIFPNLLFDSIMNPIKDECLLNICKNVADFLSVGQYCMFKKSYFKSAAWFEKAKNSASLGAEILDNY